MTTLQAWLIGGVPALVFALIAFIGRSPWRSLLGYVFLGVGFGVLASADGASAAVFAILIALFYASGRGGRMEAEPSPATGLDRSTRTSG